MALVLLIVAFLCWPSLAHGLTALDWMVDPNLLAAIFGGPTFAAGRVLVAAIFGLPMTPDMLAIYQECTRGLVAPAAQFARAFIAAGRGAGKTLLAAFIVVYIAASRDYHAILGPGELATAALFCPDRRQARVAMRFIKGILKSVPMLRTLIVAETLESVTLSTGCVIEVHTSSYKSSRGYGYAVVVIDECAFLPTDDAAQPDTELVRAVTPGLARVPGSLLLCISSPYAKRGVLWSAFQKWHGVENAPVLCWQAPTRVMNPTIAQETVDEALADDPAAARSEWLAEFRDDLESFIDTETLERCVIPARVQCAPKLGMHYTVAFDAALGGTASGDSFTACALHQEGDHMVIDHLIEVRPKFNPNAVIDRLVAELVQPYGATVVYSDRFAKDFVTDRLGLHGITHQPTQFDRSAAYINALPWFSSGRVELPDPAASVTAQRCLAQFRNLQRRTGSTGKDSIDHPRSGNDDLANVVALAISQAAAPQHGGGAATLVGFGSGDVESNTNLGPPRRPLETPPRPWRYGGVTTCPIPSNLRRTKGG